MNRLQQRVPQSVDDAGFVMLHETLRLSAPVGLRVAALRCVQPITVNSLISPYAFASFSRAPSLFAQKLRWSVEVADENALVCELAQSVMSRKCRAFVHVACCAAIDSPVKLGQAEPLISLCDG